MLPIWCARALFLTRSDCRRNHAPREPVEGSQCCTETAASTWPKLIIGTGTLKSRFVVGTLRGGSRAVDATFGRSAPPPEYVGFGAESAHLR